MVIVVNVECFSCNGSEDVTNVHRQMPMPMLTCYILARTIEENNSALTTVATPVANALCFYFKF